jgi:DNA polymerase III subunit delta
MIIFLYGEDDFSSREKLVQIQNKFLEKNSQGASLAVIDFRENNQKMRFSDAASSGGLFSPKQLIIVKNVLIDADSSAQEEILDFLKTKKSIIESKDIIVVFWESENPKGKNSLFQFLLKNSKKQKFDKIEGVKLENWIIKKTQDLNSGAKFSKGALNKLIAYSGEDPFRLENEIRKLVNFKKGEIISEEDIEFLVKAKIDANIFKTIEAMSGGNKKAALKLLHNQLEKGEDPIYILSMYVYQFRNLLKIGEFYWQGRRNQHEISKVAKLHPFVVQKTLGQLKNFTEQKLLRIYKKLQELDLKAKTGKIDINLALDKFVVEIDG